MRPAHALGILLLLARGTQLGAQTTVVVTTVLPSTGASISAAQDLAIDLATGTLRVRVPSSIESSYPNQFSRVTFASDNRFLVGAYTHIPIVTIPNRLPAAYRDLVTGIVGTVGDDVFFRLEGYWAPRGWASLPIPECPSSSCSNRR